MKIEYQHSRHNKNLLIVPLSFVTKYRRKIFYGEFRNDIKHPDIQLKYYWNTKILWSNGYFAASIGQVSQISI